MVLVGEADDLDGLMLLVPEEHQQEIRSAAAKAIASAKMHGGDWEVSYSKNGRYRLDKTPLPASIKDEIGFVRGVLFDEDGREIARWPRMYKNVFVSNTGRNLVAAEMTWGTAFDFYDRDHMEPISSFKWHIGDGQFSDDGRFFVALSAGIALFTAEGELLWRRGTEGGGMVFISPDGGCVVLSNGRPARGDEPPPVRTEHGESADPGPKVIDYRNVEQAHRQEERDQEPGTFKLPERQRVHVPQRSTNPITVFANNGDVQSVYDSHLYRIDEVTFADDGKQFAVVGTNEFLLFESDSGALLKRIAVGPPWDDIAKVAFSPDGRYLVASVTRYPTTTGPSRTRAHRYELWDLQGDMKMEMEVDELGTPAFSEDGRYVVCQEPPRSIFEGGRRIGLAPGGLRLLRVRINR
ncbi:MAG: hypothetical protein V1694_09110 [Candidatus Eisenbacteria bacterium]